MDTNVLIPLYACVLLFNLLFSSLLWLNTRALHYKVQSLAYLSFVITGLFQYQFLGSSPFMLGLLASTVFFALLPFAKLMTIITHSVFNFKRFVFVYLGGVTLTVIFDALNTNIHLTLLPCILGAAYPVLYTGVRELFFTKKNLTFITKCFIWTGVLYGLHKLDFIWAVDKPEYFGVGFSIALFMILSFVMFSTAAVMEAISIENTRVKLQMEYRAALMNSSKLASLGEMAGGVSHEIKNPLAVIQLHADLVKNALKKGEMDREALLGRMKSITETIQKIVRVITHLRYFSRDSRNDPLEDVPILDVINQTLSFCEVRFKENGVDIIKEISADAVVRCRPAQLAQALLNLLNNSFEAVSENPAEQKIIRIEVLSLEPNKVQLKVCDNGRGIPAKIRSRIFDPFFTTKDIGEGMGLGLSVALGMIESQQGTLYLEESSEQTCFVIELQKLALPIPQSVKFTATNSIDFIY